jgi:hypothetical protein
MSAAATEVSAHRGRPLLVCSTLVSLLVAACSTPLASSSPASSICEGIPADMGGCSPSRPLFTGSTCQAIAIEWGAAVDRGVVPVINGPATADGKQRSARIADVLVLASIVAGMRLHELSLLPSCDTPEFLNAAKPQFSDELKAGIGHALLDGVPEATEADWEAALVRAIRIIDEGE